MALGLSEATLIALLMESILFGAFTILFAATLYILVLRRRKRQPLNKPILAVSIAMYVMAIMHLAVDMRRVIIGFISDVDRAGGSDAYLNALSDPLYIFKSAIYTMQTLIGDGFVIYRLYVVWGRDKRIIIPAVLCLLGSFTAGVGTLVSFSKVSPTALVFITDLKHWITSFFSITLFTNISCTSLIAFRIWWTERQSSVAFRSRSLSPVAVIIVESGAIYSTALISLLATYLSSSWGQYPVLDSVTQLIGVVFSLIIVRIGLGISSDETTCRATSGSHRISVGHRMQKSPPQPVVVQMTHTRTARDDSGETLDISNATTLSSGTIGLDSKGIVVGSDDGIGAA